MIINQPIPIESSERFAFTINAIPTRMEATIPTQVMAMARFLTFSAIFLNIFPPKIKKCVQPELHTPKNANSDCYHTISTRQGKPYNMTKWNLRFFQIQFRHIVGIVHPIKREFPFADLFMKLCGRFSITSFFRFVKCVGCFWTNVEQNKGFAAVNCYF